MKVFKYQYAYNILIVCTEVPTIIIFCMQLHFIIYYNTNYCSNGTYYNIVAPRVLFHNKTTITYYKRT